MAGGGGGGRPECEVLAWTNIPGVRVAGGGGRPECEVLPWINIPGGRGREGVRGGGGLDCEVLAWTNIPEGRGRRAGGGGVWGVRYWRGPTFQEARGREGVVRSVSY